MKNTPRFYLFILSGIYAVCPMLHATLISNGDFSTSPISGGIWTAPGDSLHVWYGRSVSEGSATDTVGGQDNLWVTTDPANSHDPYLRPASGGGPGIFQVIAYPGVGVELAFSYDYFNTDVSGWIDRPPYVSFYGINDGDPISVYFNMDEPQIGATFTPADNETNTFVNTGEQTVTLSGSYQYLAVSIKDGSVDNFTLTVVPEPSSLMLIFCALGGFLTTLYRRR